MSIVSTFLLFVAVLSVSAQTLDSKDQIKDYAIEQSYIWDVRVSMFLGIIESESNFEKDAKNPNSTASGVMQYLNSTFLNYCVKKFQLANSLAEKNDPKIQIDCAVRMLANGGAHHWEESRFAWSKNLVLE